MAKKKKTKAAKAKQTKEQISSHKQMTAVILFAVAVLTFCLAIIEGEKAWAWLHNGLLGLFSFSAYLLPFALGAYAVFLALEKDSRSVKAHIWECVTFIVMLMSTIFTFTTDVATEKFFPAFATAFANGRELRGGGALGVLLGHPAESAFGDTGAKIILILLMVVFFMLVTGTSIMQVVRMVRKPIEKTKEGIGHVVDEIAGRQGQHVDIDIDIGDGYPKNGRKKRRTEEDAEDATDDVAEIEYIPAPSEMPKDKLAALEKANEALNSDEPEVEGPSVKELAAETQAEMKVHEEEESQQEMIYRYPPLSLLDESSASSVGNTERELRLNGELLVNTLRDFGINTRLADITRGPAVTRYELEPSAGVKISRITGLADDIALRLATSGVRIEAPIPNKAAVGIEVPNKSRNTVCLRSLLDTPDFRTAKGKLTVALGQDIEGNAVMTDLAKMPHLLIAGTTGSGKSVCTNSMIQSVLFRARPDEVKMILIDPKKVEFGVYNGIPHLLIPVVTDPRKAAGALGWAVNEMLKRYQMFAEANVRDIGGYNEMARTSETIKPLPLILIVIDELADLMMAAANEVEDSICRLAQMARAAGMHMVIATQRPSVDVITGLIKANIPSRLALTVASGTDSRTILDANGAEKLLGYGDMLFMPVGQSKPRRVQGCFVTNKEIERVIDFLKNADKPLEYDQEIINEIEKQAAAAGRASSRGEAMDDDDGDDTDEALPQAIEIALDAGQISTSMLQRKMRVGYARAGRIIDQMEQRGIIGPSVGSKPRELLITRQQWIEMNMNGEE